MNDHPSLNTNTSFKNQGQSKQISLPVHSLWFKMDGIDEIERRAMPEFFSTNREESEQEYMKNRNYIIQTYRMNPSVYFSFTMCRRFVVGDVASLLRLHSFLEQWSLINADAQWPKGKRMPLPSSFERTETPIPSIIKDSLHGGAELTSHTLSSKAAKNKGNNKKMTTISCTICSKGPLEKYYCASTLLSEEEGKSRTLFVSATTPYISSTTQKTTKTIDPVPQNCCKPELLICCPCCFSESKYCSFSKTFKIDDFKFVDLSLVAQMIKKQWTEEEEELLLVEVDKSTNSSTSRYTIDWEGIANKLGRTKEECIAKFLKIPLEFDSIILKNADQLLPFETVANPLLTTLSFLVGSLPPKVAAAASAAALNELDRLDAGDGSQATLASKQLAQVASVAMAAVQTKAADYVAEEDKKIEHLRLKLLESQMKKVALKMRMLEDIERQAELDRKDLEHQRLQLFYERFNLRRQMGGDACGVSGNAAGNGFDVELNK